jgi:hypothetical protein
MVGQRITEFHIAECRMEPRHRPHTDSLTLRMSLHIRKPHPLMHVCQITRPLMTPELCTEMPLGGPADPLTAISRTTRA